MRRSFETMSFGKRVFEHERYGIWYCAITKRKSIIAYHSGDKWVVYLCISGEGCYMEGKKVNEIKLCSAPTLKEALLFS